VDGKFDDNRRFNAEICLILQAACLIIEPKADIAGFCFYLKS
jgi:hypothetical protein